MSATRVIQDTFGWSISSSALLVGAVILTTGVSVYLTGRLTFRIKDKVINLVASVVALAVSPLLFQYRDWSEEASHWTATLPYLVGSLVFMNAVTISMVGGYALSAKVCYPRETEPVQSLMGLIGLLSRGVGAIAGDYLSNNAIAGLFSALCVTVIIGNIVFYRRLG